LACGHVIRNGRAASRLLDAQDIEAARRRDAVARWRRPAPTGSRRSGDDAYGRLLRDPRDGVTGSSYVVVADADAVHARAVAAGAPIVMPIRDEAYGGRGFGLRDPEGHVWYVGTYDPWARPDGLRLDKPPGAVYRPASN
jgi:hypothetical protein